LLNFKFSQRSLGWAQTNVAKLLLLYAEAFLLPLKAICYILLLIKAKAFLLIVPQSSSWLKMMQHIELDNIKEDYNALPFTSVCVHTAQQCRMT
jgi:hypothetical protein